ncbi:hypothetical protein Q0Z83_054050 [Actinoplanes sichuanensis]|uniref:Aldehyde dehydrogenase family protein n=1 Tax=Actinoplanes sichuanensis TaxID=512349 RepID=A0ABW4AT60_9ACTN|nr:aldehyde dehydrogenase family protein [Actinoplanes sichuanensis]BEL07214.1 hypothetical protein Q0Z83_054050 [Actinoplanes sichuanensis]
MKYSDEVAAFRRLLVANRADLIELCMSVETLRTAEVEWAWALTDPEYRRVAWLSERRPLGTIYVRMPATLPVYSFFLFVVGSLLPGNRVVVRPAAASRHVVAAVGELAVESGLPVDVQTGDWSSFEASAKQEADGVVFCGGPERADQLDSVLPERVRLLYQGPGSCAFVVTAEADLEQAAAAVVRTRLFNSSQDCLATERVYVAEAVRDGFFAALDAVLDRVRYGENRDPRVDVGPLLLDKHADDWYGRVAGGEGRVHRAGRHLGGSLYEACVVEAAPDSELMLAEKYCPIIPVATYESDRRLRDMLSLGDYALGLTVYGRLPSFGTLDFGHVAINKTQYDLENPMSPFGGRRRTTFVRAGSGRRSGPALVPFEMSLPL